MRYWWFFRSLVVNGYGGIYVLGTVVQVNNVFPLRVKFYKL